MTASMTDREMLAAMWAWKVRMPHAIEHSTIPSASALFGRSRAGDDLDVLIAPIVFLQVHGTAAQVKARWEAMRAAMVANRDHPITQSHGSAVEATLTESMNLLRDTIYPAARAAEAELARLGCRFDPEKRMADIPSGGRPRTLLRAAAVAVLRPYRRAYLNREGRGPSAREMQNHLRERLSGVFDQVDPGDLAKAVDNAFEEIVEDS